MSRQFKEELKKVDRIKSDLVFSQMQCERQTTRSAAPDFEGIEDRLREEINKKMEICVRLINSNAGEVSERERGLGDRVNELAFTVNQLENECRRNKMMHEKDIDRLTSVLKDNSTAIPNHSRVTEREVPSRSPGRGTNLIHSKSKNSRSDKSLSRGKQNKSAVLISMAKEQGKVREDEMREALRKKKDHK